MWKAVTFFIYGGAELTEAYAEKIDEKEIHQHLSAITPGDLNIFLYNFLCGWFFSTMDKC